ncbi:MAG: AMP-binding protein [Trueperaceae bacterium]|nr:AMP-binding protein [Trueperaceae bacterium]
MNIAEILQQQARERAAAIAIYDTHKRQLRQTSFSQLEQAAAQMAQLLAESGLKKGDAVLVFQPMSLELYILLSALFRLGLIALFIDPSAAKGHLDRCCQLYPPRALVASSKAHLLRLVSKELGRIPLKFSFGFPVPGARRLEPYRSALPLDTIEPCSSDVPALITFTSGSTGQPKAAVRSHGFLIAQHRALEHSLELRAGELDVSTLPIFVLANLASGVSSLIPNADLRKPGKIQAAPVMRQILELHPDRLSASPAFIERLVEHSRDERLSLPGLSRVYTGGAPVFPTALADFQALAPDARVAAVYGSTEAEPIAHVNWTDVSQSDKEAMSRGKGLLTGPICPDLSLSILKNNWGRPLGLLSKAEFDELVCAPYHIGEIVVSGDHVLPGYLHGVGYEETKFDVEGQRWHRTGDLGYLDEERRLWLMGRCAALIEDDKGCLYPFAVECAAQHYQGVRRSAVIAHKDKRLLIIEPRASSQPDLLAIKQGLAWAKLDEIIFMKLPVDKRHNAKIDYPALRKKLEQHRY